jgi:pimeloyl-ACP methyl ester carboxylesterase
MKTRNKLFTLMILTSSAAAAITVINKCLQLSATSKNILTEQAPLCYKWRLGNVHYTKTGSGKPLLLIHNLNASCSGYEWNAVVATLSAHYTVYNIDLLGCGRSEKPNMTYTNYLYVQLITDFIKSVIGHRTSVITSGESASIPIMACANEPTLFDQIMMINPLSLADFSRIPGKSAKLYKFLIDTPILGTLVYHIAVSRRMIRERLEKDGFYNPFSVKESMLDSFHEAAHLGKMPKSVYASQRCNYTKCNLVNALRKIDNSIYLIGGDGIDHIRERLEEYKEYNSAIETTYIPETKLFPHMEKPEQLCSIIKTYLL